MFSFYEPLILLAFVFSVSAQYPYYYGDNGSLTGSVIAGIVIAVVCGLLVLSLCCLFGMRRRRGQPVLGGRFTRRPNSYISQGPTNANEMNTFGETGSNQQSGYSQPTTDTSQVPPPPYHSKNSYQGSANGNIPQGGYPAPPGQPPAAHVNENDRYGWSNRNT